MSSKVSPPFKACYGWVTVISVDTERNALHEAVFITKYFPSYYSHFAQENGLRMSESLMIGQQCMEICTARDSEDVLLAAIIGERKGSFYGYQSFFYFGSEHGLHLQISSG